MGRPEITADQREIAIVLLANAIRKDAHLRDRALRAGQENDPVRAGMLRRRSEPSQRYIDGMRDLLRVLFISGDALVDECLEEAYARAMGFSAHEAANDTGTMEMH